MQEVPTAEPTTRSGTSPRVVSPQQLLDLREQSWGPSLRSVSLVAEAEIRAETSSQVAAALGHLYARLLGRHETGIRFLLRWPACVAAAMVGAAVSGYEAGTYWPAFWIVTGYRGGIQDQAAWGKTFALAIERLGMATFPGMPLRYVGPILMHAGIPAYCLGDYFRLLLERRRRDPGMDAENFLAWATSPGRDSRLFGLDVPVRRFLSHGGEYAQDVVDRSLDLLERLNEPDPDLGGIRLPAYIIEAARAEMEAGRLDLSAARRTMAESHGTQARPRIGLDPFGQGVQVILPPVGDAPDGIASWRVTADGSVAIVQSRALWVGAAEAAPETTYPLSRPVRSVLVSLSGRNLTAELRVVEPADPILFFADDGRQIPGSLSLPRGRVWILHPADRELVVTGEMGQVAEPPVPFGWDGWRLRLLSLDNVEALSLGGTRSHPVHGQARPRLLLDDPIRGVTTPYGSPVYDRSPSLWLPGAPEAPVSWHVDVHRASGGRPLLSMAVQGPSELDLGQHLPRPLLGAFEITVRGPLGRGMRRTVFVADRLTVRYQPTVRGLTADGLRPGTAVLTAAMGAKVMPQQLRFGAHERARIAEYKTEGETEPLVITPPHVALLCAGGGATTWTAAPLRLATEAFADAGRLLIRIPDLAEPPDLEIWIGGVQVQVIPASGQRTPGLTGYELSRGNDTIAEHGRAELILPLAGRSMLVGIVRPRSLASGADLGSGQLRLREYRHVDGLMAGVYRVFAPWRGPVIQPVSTDGVVGFPDELRNAGPVRILLRVEDLWATSNWPPWPGADSFHCDNAGVPASDDPEQDELSRFVAGIGGTPERLHHLERLWQLLQLANELIPSGARADLSERCAEALRRQPRAAVLALLETGFDDHTCVPALISSGIAALHPEEPLCEDAADRHDRVDEIAKASHLWSSLPAAAAILTGDLLAEGCAEEGGQLAALAESAIAQCGDSLSKILCGEDDPHASVGRFGPDAERMAHLSREQVEALWQAAAVVPQALLDVDTRAVAARRAFDARRSPALKRAAREAAPVVKCTEQLLRVSRYPWLIRQIAARRHPDGAGGWLAIPAMSMALALVARIAARGNEKCRSFEWLWRELWAGLARAAPDLAGIDLILAEALVAGAEATQTQREYGDG